MKQRKPPKLDRLSKLIIKQVKKEGGNYRICYCGAIHTWKKGHTAKIIPIEGQPCLMIVEKEKRKK